ncbi:hypothetical protein GCM10010449_83430 [Streptomyces rectiviolaceus]|uniref:Uncharacterized protein n=1 Tax=Streptomyces rectiviolaceus TaxID=332591 RepID=A0ABP6NM33_9ACTN
MAKVRGPSSVPVSGALLHAVADLVTAVAEFDRYQTPSHEGGLPALVRLRPLVREGEASCFGSGVYAHLYAVDFRLDASAVLEPDGERDL